MTINSEPNPLDPIDPPDSIDQIRSNPTQARGSCFFGHKWSLWIDIKDGVISINDRNVGRYAYQEHRCVRCNKVELQKTTT